MQSSYFTHITLDILGSIILIAMIGFIAFGWLKGLAKEREYMQGHKRRYR